MYVHIGTGKEKAQHVTNRLLKILVDKGNEEAEKPTVAHRPPPRASWPHAHVREAPEEARDPLVPGIVVKGVDDVLVRLSRCCNPVPATTSWGL